MVSVIAPRDVPLGGPGSMTVRRTLPAQERSFVGAWCLVDHYGPDVVYETGGMDVPPHPHCGLQTMSWLFSGKIEHRDSEGNHTIVRPGELNLMTAGRGISHSEVSTPGTTVLQGVQLWVVLPLTEAGITPSFERYVPRAVEVDRATLKVFVGSLGGHASPVPTHTPLVGAEVRLPGGVWVTLAVDPGFELGVLGDSGSVELDGLEVAPGALGVRTAKGRRTITLGNPGTGSARCLLLGGEPFGEEVVMWWKLIGRSHDEVAAARKAWEARSRFGTVEGYAGDVDRLPAPELPTARLKPQGNRRR